MNDSSISNEDGGTVELSETERHRLLASEQRRAALDFLAKRTTPIELEALAAEIAGRQDGTAPESEAVKRVAVSLHHNHLPRMDDLGVIDYDPASGRIGSVRIAADLLTRPP